MPRSQQRSAMAIQTPLGDDVMLLRSFSGHEGLSELFHYHAEMDSENHALAHQDILGKNVTIRLELPNEETRYWNGFVSRFSQTGVSEEGLAVYHADVVPWLWFLTRTADCRIFQHVRVSDILETLFGKHGFSNYRLELTGDYPEREYCVQYRETTFNFVSRLLEEEGMFYYFAHSNGTHDLVIADSRSRLSAWPGYDEIRFLGPGRSVAPGENLTAWNAEYEFHTGAVAQTDYNFQTPATNLRTNASTVGLEAQKNFELYDYPGQYADIDTGNRRTRTRMEELEWQQEVYRGKTTARGLAPGYVFRVRGHPRTDESTDFLVVGADYLVKPEPGGDAHFHDEQYACEFTAIDAERPFRPPRRARKPIVEGPQTAVVVGPAGEEIYPDQYGRVIVQFHWDREGSADENSSCWIRVAQGWAGRRWGAMFMPRIGQEVIVEFLEGDPDRPIVTGRVYHAQNMPPYDLPQNKTMSGIKSNSSKNGQGFNEIRFQDKKGEEQIFIHAENDHDIRVKRDCLEWIGNNRHLVVKTDQFEKVENDRHENVSHDHTEQIGNDRHLKVGGKEAKAVNGTLSLKVGGNVAEEFSRGHSEKTTENYCLKALGIVIEADSGITIKCGQNSVVIDQAGVTLKGGMITIDGGMTKINTGPGSPAASASFNTLVSPASPTDAEEADDADPGEVAETRAQQREQRTGRYGAVQVSPFRPDDADQEGSWIRIRLVDREGNPMPGEPYQITLPDGSIARGSLDDNGQATIRGIDPGSCDVVFTNMDRRAWNRR